MWFHPLKCFFFAPNVPQVVTCAVLPDLGFCPLGAAPSPATALLCRGCTAEQAAGWGQLLSGFTNSFIALVLPALPIQEKKRPFIILTPFLGAGAGQAALPVPHPLLTAQLP